jgi:hypothetical protein
MFCGLAISASLTAHLPNEAHVFYPRDKCQTSKHLADEERTSRELTHLPHGGAETWRARRTQHSVFTKPGFETRRNLPSALGRAAAQTIKCQQQPQTANQTYSHTYDFFSACHFCINILCIAKCTVRRGHHARHCRYIGTTHVGVQDRRSIVPISGA